MFFSLANARRTQRLRRGMQVFAIFAAWRARFSQVVIILSQRRGGREGSAGYIGLCDLCGLARKKYPASNEALAKARRARRLRWGI